MSMQDAIDEFAAHHPRYSSPDGARDKCTAAAFEFGGYVTRFTGLDWEVIDGMHTDEGGVVLWAHSALHVGDDVYDWTARQFYPLADWPAVFPLERWTEMLVPFREADE